MRGFALSRARRGRRAALAALLAAAVPACFDDGGGELDADQPLSQPTFHTPHFDGYANCAACHARDRDAFGRGSGIAENWLPSMMSNAFRDPLWQAKVRSEIARHPGQRAMIENECNHCHGPIAGDEATLAGEEVRLFDHDGAPGLRNPSHPRYSEAMEGVSCTVCHQFTDTSAAGPKASFSGKWQIDYGRASPGRPLYGQYDDPATTAMGGWVPTGGAHMTSANLCGTCHEIEVPTLDPVTGKLTGGHFTEQTTWSEWSNSDFGQAGGPAFATCQDCHMPPTIGVLTPGGRMRSDWRLHDFRGPNTVMMELLAGHRAKLGVDPSVDFASAITRARQFLATHAASVSISAVRQPAEAEVRVTVQNLTGHKFPTGVAARRAWIHFKLSDARGAVLFESGRPAGDGSIPGLPADRLDNTYEPHHTEITSPDQVQIYESIMKDASGEQTCTLLSGRGYLKDNRLLPRGFRALPETAPVGLATTDPDFVPGGDTVVYRVPVTVPGPLFATATLYYQAVARPFVNDLAEDKNDPLVARFLEMFEAGGTRYETVAEASAVVR